MAEQLKGYPNYDIDIKGHTSCDNWNDPVAFKKEHEEELIPLSKARAVAVKAALVERGLDPGSINTIGMGGSDPIVPFKNREEQWKNRRVDIILTKKKQIR